MSMQEFLPSHFPQGLAGLAIAMFLAMVVLVEVGRRAGRRRIAADPDGAFAGAGTVDAAIFALLGLLIAFSFGGAAARLDARRALIVQEANDIGTAWLRLDLVAPAAQPALRDRLRRYVDARIETYAAMPDLERADAANRRATALQVEIWALAVPAVRASDLPQAATLVLPALNGMFDIAATRMASMIQHSPPVVFVLLVMLTLMSALVAGYASAPARRRDWLHTLLYATVLTVTVYVIVDLEFPRLGLIRIDAMDTLLVDVRSGMK